MRILKKTKKKILTEVTIEDKTICDKCGKDITWEGSGYDVVDFEFEFKTGNQYPEGGGGDLISLDLCGTCANKAVDVLEKEGFNIQRSEWDN